MSQDEVLENRIRIKPEWLKKSDALGALRAAQVFIPLGLMLAAAPYLWLDISPFAVLLLLPFLGAEIYKLTIVMHECSHFSLFKSRQLNETCGIVCGGLLGSDFKAFTHLHWLHHQKYGAAEDPQGTDYLGFKNATKVQLAWHLLRPLLGYNLLSKLGAFQIKNSTSATKDKGNPNQQRLRTLTAILIAQGTVALLATGFGTVPWLVFLYPFCAATFALFFSQIRGFCEHISSPDGTEEAHVRTHLPHWFDKLFFYALNFNYHVEHHLFPSVPSQHLPLVNAEIRNNLHTAQTLSPTIWQTIRTRLSEAKA